jgi:hypothetical protein
VRVVKDHELGENTHAIVFAHEGWNWMHQAPRSGSAPITAGRRATNAMR